MPTHDWSRSVDLQHLAEVRAAPAPGGVLHLLLEVLAYVADEATATGPRRCRVVLRPDGSVSVADDGRGTDTRIAARGVVRKPVVATKDLRFDDDPAAQLLSDGHPRRGMSTVAALSDWLVHTNRRLEGAWTQRYARGVPVTDLLPVEPNGTAGTTVDFLPSAPTVLGEVVDLR